ncbi:MAG: DUF3078 domain-containing protein [Flavobacteriales bacterium]|nr:DUF3078 domain-containing protein [Flavobacteriales bacterium]
MRTKVLSLTIAFALFAVAITAQEAEQDTTWKTGGLFGLGISQVSLTNWAAGGLSSISGNANLNLFAHMLDGKNSWDNDLILGYGLQKQGEDGDVVKTDDRIDFSSKYGREAWSPEWYYSALANFRTQFTEGLGADILADDGTILVDDPVISDILAPAYVLASLGLDYKPNENLTVFISPVTAKFTIVNDDILAAGGAFGVDPGELGVDDEGNTIVVTPGSSSRSEFGGYFKLGYTTAIMENVNFLTKLDLFSNYENPTLIDVNWDALINMKVNDYITASLGATVLYDHDINILDSDGKVGPRTQFRQLFGVGFTYAL